MTGEPPAVGYRRGVEATLLWILAAVLVIVGLAGVVLPALPGAPLVLAGLVAGAAADGFTYVGPWALVGLGVLAALTYAADFVAGAFGAQKFGASKRAVAGAVLGALLGLFAGIPGVILGPFVGAVIGELSQHGDLRKAGRAGLGATLGLALGAAAKVSLMLTMLAIFATLRWILPAV